MAVVPPGPGGMGDAGGPEALDLQFILENDTDYDRKEVVGVTCPFPSGNNGIYESELADYHFRLLQSATVPADVDLPTAWTLLTTWPNGQVRVAKGWCGKTDGTGVDIPKRNAATNVRGVQYLKLIKSITLKNNLPTYAQHASVTSGLISGTFQSEVFDVYVDAALSRSGNLYRVDATNSTEWYEDTTLENTKWMKVIRRRSYHRDIQTSATSLNRDLFSLTWYLYIPHNSRCVDLEVRLGNDYQGRDAELHTNASYSLGTGNGVTRIFTGTLPYAFAGHGAFPKGYLRVSAGASVSGQDGQTLSGGVGEITGPGIVKGANSYVNYATGAISVEFAVAPLNLVPVLSSYRYAYWQLYVGAGGTSFTGAILPSRPNAHSLHVQAGTVEGKDNGLGQVVPFYHTNVVNELWGTGTASQTVFTGTAVGKPLIKGALLVKVGTGTTVFGRDNGLGTISGVGISAGTINYTTGAYSITFSTAPGSGIQVLGTYSYDVTGATLILDGTVNYTTGAVDLTFRTAPTNGTKIQASYIKNDLATSFSQNPNYHPLGPMPFNRWGLVFDTDHVTDSHMEAISGYRASTFVFGGDKRGYTICGCPRDTIGGAIPAGGFQSDYVQEHLTDGSSVPRIFFLYFGAGASAAENDTFAARKLHPITPIAKRETYNATRALGLFEGALKFLTPTQLVAPGNVYTRSYTTEAIARDKGTIHTLNQATAISAVTAWSSGNFQGGGTTTTSVGSRACHGWHEQGVPTANAAGAPRNGHAHCLLIYYSQAWQAVRYFYHAGLHGYTRVGQVLWNFENAHTWSRRPFYKYQTAPGDNGLVPFSTTGGQYFITNQEPLNRTFRRCFGRDKIGVTNNSTTVTFTNSAGSSLSANDIAYYSQNANGFSTYAGSTVYAGYRRLVVDGHDRTYILTATWYDFAAGFWKGTLSSPYQGTTTAPGSEVSYAICNDPEPGVSVLPKNDTRSYALTRIAFLEENLQHGMSAENASHCSQDAAFEVWETTGSWLLWDKVRLMGEFFLGAYKDKSPFDPTGTNQQQFRDESRANAWSLKNVLTAYLVTKALAGRSGFEFLTSAAYGSAPDRYKEFIESRNVWRLSTSPLGLMDPAGLIAVSGKEKIKDFPIDEGRGLDWGNPENVGSTNPLYGGGTALGNPSLPISEVQMRFGEGYFTYSSTWQLGYILPYIWACYREFRYETKLLSNGLTLPATLLRLGLGGSSYVLDYCLLYGLGPYPGRLSPGFVSQTLGRFGLLFQDPLRGGSHGFPVRFCNDNYGQGYSWVIPISSPYLSTTPPYYPALTDSDTPIATYYNRLGSDTAVQDWVTSKQTPGLKDSPSPHVDTIGWPVAGTFRAHGQDITTFDGGIPHPGTVPPVLTVPSCTNPPGQPPRYPCQRAPTDAETFYHEGVGNYPDGLPDGINAALSLVAYYAARYHTNTQKRALAIKLLNNWLYNLMAFSHVNGRFSGVNANTKGSKFEYEEQFLGPITGDFPHADGGLGQVTGWWDTTWRRRRRVSTSGTHSVYTGGRDVLGVNVTTYGIPTFSQLGLGDLRVVHQTDTNLFTLVPSTLRRDPASGDYFLYFVPTQTIQQNEDVGLSVTQAYYVYYSNPGAASSTAWSNTDSIDGPYASDANTVALWNSEGSIGNDAGPNSQALATIAGFSPSHIKGIFGGASHFQKSLFQASFVSANFSVYAWQGSFCLDFWVLIRTLDRDSGVSELWSLLSLADDTVAPILVYLNTVSTDRALRGRFTVGQGTSYSVVEVAIPQGTRTVLATGNGSQTVFSGTLVAPVIASSFYIYVAGSSVAGYDYGAGTISGTGITSGTLSYLTGAWSVTFSSPPAGGVQIISTHTTSTTQYPTDRWVHIKLDYSSTTLTPYVGGVAGTGQAVSGSLAVVSQVTSFVHGAFYTPSTFFTSFANIKLAEVRLSRVDRPATYKVATPVTPVLQAEEALSETEELALTSRGTLTTVMDNKLTSRGSLASGMTAPNLVGAGYLVNAVGLQASTSSRGYLVILGYQNPLTCRGTLSLPSLEPGLSLTSRGTLATPQQGQVSCSGYLSINGLSHSLLSKGTLATTAELPLVSKGSFLTSNTQLPLVSSGYLQAPTVQLLLLSKGAFGVVNLQVVLTSKGDLLSSSGILLFLPSRGYLAVAQSHDLFTRGYLQVVNTSSLLASKGHVVLAGQSVLTSKGYLQVLGTQLLLSCKGELIAWGAAYTQVASVGYLQVLGTQLLVTSRGTLATGTSLSLSSRGYLGVLGVQLQLTSKGAVQVLGVQLQLTSKGAFQTSNLQQLLTSKGYLQTLGFQQLLTSKGYLQISGNVLFLASKGHLLDAVGYRYLVCAAYVQGAASSFLVSRGQLAVIAQQLLTSRGYVVGVQLTAPLVSKGFIYSLLDVLTQLPTASALAVARTNSLTTRGTLATTKQVALIGAGYLIVGSLLLTPSSPITITGKPVQG